MLRTCERFTEMSLLVNSSPVDFDVEVTIIARIYIRCKQTIRIGVTDNIDKTLYTAHYA